MDDGDFFAGVGLTILVYIVVISLWGFMDSKQYTEYSKELGLSKLHSACLADYEPVYVDACAEELKKYREAPIGEER